METTADKEEFSQKIDLEFEKLGEEIQSLKSRLESSQNQRLILKRKLEKQDKELTSNKKKLNKMEAEAAILEADEQRKKEREENIRDITDAIAANNEFLQIKRDNERRRDDNSLCIIM